MSDEQTQLAATKAFIADFTGSEVGGYLHPSLRPQLDPVTGLSIFSTSSVPSDERLVSCPHEHVITPLRARRAIDAVCPNAGEGVDGWKETMLICGYICLHWIYPGRTELRHAAYIASLPPSSTLRTPLHFSDAEMALLEGTNLHGATLDRRRQWQEEWATVKAVLGDGVTWERYLTAATYISSRAFPSKLLATPASGEGKTETSAVQTSAEETSHPVLIPGMDMFNHARGQPITWLSSPGSGEKEGATISLVTPSGIEADQQVFNNYGPKPNEELLLGYGFVLDPNPDDVVPLRLGNNLGGNLSDGKRRRLEAKKLDMGERCLIKRDGLIPQGLMEVLRIVLGDESHQHDHDDEEEEPDHGHWEEEMELEQDVLGALGQMLEDKLVRLEQAAAEAEGAEGRDDVKAMCEVYRRGQIEILEKAMETVEERIDRVERLTAEGQGCPCCN